MRARAYASDVLGEWHVPEDVADALTLVVSELVTNSVRHTASTTVMITVALTEDAVWAGVSDQGGSTLPSVREAAPTSQSGRGLSLVDALTSWWTTTSAAGQTDVVAAVNSAATAARVSGGRDGDGRGPYA